jgi:hypothetical protein
VLNPLYLSLHIDFFLCLPDVPVQTLNLAGIRLALNNLHVLNTLNQRCSSYFLLVTGNCFKLGYIQWLAASYHYITLSL